MSIFNRSNGSSSSLTDQAPKLSQSTSNESTKKPSFFNRILSGRTGFMGGTGDANSRSPSPSQAPDHTENSHSSDDLDPPNTLALHGYRPSTKHRLLDHELANNIRNLLPPRLQLFDDWDLVYSLEQDGISLNTLYRNSDPEYQLQQYKKQRQEKGYGDSIVKSMMVGDQRVTSSSSTVWGSDRKRPQGYIIIIHDEKRNKFGCYLNTNLRPVDNKRYYGNGECFLWKVEKFDPSSLNHEHTTHQNQHQHQHQHENEQENQDVNLIDLDDEPPHSMANNPSPENSEAANEDTKSHHPHPHHSHGKKTKQETRFKAFMYTGINDNVIFSNHDFIAIGSSSGQNGLWIDRSLYKGVSYPCTTFGNEILNSQPASPPAKMGTFKVIDMEIWRVGSLE